LNEIPNFVESNRLCFADTRAFLRLVVDQMRTALAGCLGEQCGIREISLAEGNRSFRISGKFSMSFDGTSVIRSLGAACDASFSWYFDRVNLTL
jgi:hypothetical protein